MSNISGYLKSLVSSLSTVATSGSYTDLINKPIISTAGASGAYNDLTGKPTLGTAAALDVGNNANQILQKTSDNKYPVGDGSNLFNVTSGLQSLFKTGLGLSHNTTTPNTKLDITTGKCRSIQDNYDLVLSSGQTLDITQTTDRGGSLTNAAWYRVFLISNGTTTKAWMNIETDTSMANLPSGYTYYRRIGVIQYIDSTNGIRRFHTWLNKILWNSSFDEIYTIDTTYTDYVFTLVAPTGISVSALLGAEVGNNAANAYPWLIVRPKNSQPCIDIASANVGGASVGLTPVPIISKDRQLLFSFSGASNRFGRITNLGFEDYFID